MILRIENKMHHTLKNRNDDLNITIFRPRMIIGPGRLGILQKLFTLIKHNLPIPIIGNGSNNYQMISVFDCVSATISAIDKGCPNRTYNLGSKNPPSEIELLQNLITSVGSKSPILKTPGKVVKGILSIFENIGIEIMYKEQYMIADEQYILDTSLTERDLSWKPQYSDTDMLISAYMAWLNGTW